MASDLLRERLPPGWHLGVTDDGRIFFIDDDRQETSWLHPVTGLPVESGLHGHPDLPRGWEQDTTRDGLPYYVDHNRGVTTFEHPLYGYGTPPPPLHYNENVNQQHHHQQQQQHPQQRQNHQAPPPSQPDHSPLPPQSPSGRGSPTSPGGKENFKRGTPKQRSVKAPSAKRNPQSVVVKRGWLHRLENTGISKSKAWKRRWCVLADFALFIYKGEDEQTTLDSILLPSYRINPSTEADNIKRNFVFKVEHENTKTLYLAAEDSPDSVSWMSHLRQAAMMDGNIGSFQREQNNNFRQHPSKGGGPANRSNTSPMDPKHPLSNPTIQNTNRYDPGGNTSYGPQHSPGRSPSYQGYGDPAASPPYDQRQPFQSQAQQPQYNPQRQSYTSNDDGGFNPNTSSLGFNRDSQADGYPPSSRGDESFRSQQHDPRNFSNPVYHQYPSPSASSSASSRPQFPQHQQQHQKPYNQQQQPLRDGFAPDSDSARNSLAQSDASGGRRSYQPAQAERQRLQQQLGGFPSGGMDPRSRSSYTSHPPHNQQQHNYSPQSPHSAGRHPQGPMDSFQRDSYSGESSSDGPHHQRPYSDNHPASHQVVVKQLRPWDTSFPDLEVVTAKQHGSFDDLLDPGNRVGRQSARGPGGPGVKPTFNARSKSHENFSRLPPEERPPGVQQPQRAGQPQQFSPPQREHPQQQQGYGSQQQQQHSYDSHDAHNISNTNNEGHQSFRDSTRPAYGGSPQGSAHSNHQGYMRHPHHPQQQQHQHQQSPAGSFSSPHGSPQERHLQRDGQPPHSTRSHQQSFRNSYASSTNVVPPYNPNASSQLYPGPSPGSNNVNASFRGSARGNTSHPSQTRPLSLSSAQGGPPSPSTSSQNYPARHPSINPHTYVNFPNREPAHSRQPSYPEDMAPHSAGAAPPPDRPPYPVAVRRQMVEEMAQVQTPVTQNDFLISAELNQQRMQQPSYFQYPSPRDQFGNKIPSEAANPHSRVSGSHLESARNLPNSRLSSASRASTASRRGDSKRGPSDLHDSSRRSGDGGGHGSPPHETSFSRTNMMDPEAQKLRMAYERVHSLRMAPDKVKTSQGYSAPGRAPNTDSRNSNRPKQRHSYSHADSTGRRGQNSNVKGGYPLTNTRHDKDGFDQHQTAEVEPVAREQHQRAYKSQEDLNRVGRTPPPTGAYHRIPDEPVDLYKRGSAFSPPAAQIGGSMQVLDSGSQPPREGREVSRWLSVDALSGNQPRGLDSAGHGSLPDGAGYKRNRPQEQESVENSAHSSLYQDKRSSLAKQQSGGIPDKNSSQNYDGIVRARLVSIYDNVEQGHTVENKREPPSHADLTQRGISGGESSEYERDGGSAKKKDDFIEGQAASHAGQGGLERLFFEPYVNMRDAKVLFPPDAGSAKGGNFERPQFKLAAPPKRKPAPIQTVKEDPNMSDREVLETNLQKIAKKTPLAGPRLRMSISAGDLIGKTHDELVLLLIQLRRNQAALEKARDYYRTLIDRCRPDELEYKRQMHQFGNIQDHRLLHRHQNFVEARAQTEEVENKLEVYKPIINLLDNMVTMGSLYGGDNLMLATQYRKHLLRPDQYQPPKKMLEFSRQHQEQRLQQETEEEIRQLSSDEVDLEEKIDRLNVLDRLLQEQSFKVSSFREDKELLEKALVGVLRQQDQSYHGDPREMTRLTNQQRMLEKEISRFTQQLAEASKELEETSAENSKLEHEVALLRTKVHGELSRSRSAPSLSSENVRTKQQMEKELAKVEGIMAGLNQQGQKLQQAMSTIRRSSSSSHLAAANLDKADGKAGISPTSPYGTYLQTDLDSGEQLDLAQASSPFANGSHNSYHPDGEGNGVLMSDGASSRPVINHQRQNAGSLEDWDMEGVDENTKRFFGLMPRDKPKGQTLREVKRMSEQRKEREKVRRDGDDSLDGQEIKLRVSNVDTEVSSIIHARIPSEASNKINNNGSQYESGLPLYENLPTSSKTNGINYNPQTARRSSLILMAPKPFTPYQDRSSARPFKSELALNVAGSDTHNSGPFPAVWQPSSATATVNDRPYRSVDFLNAPIEPSVNTSSANAAPASFNTGIHHKRGDSSLYSSDANNNDSDSLSYNNPAGLYENDYVPQGNTIGGYHHQYQPSDSSQQEQPSDSADHITRPVDPNAGQVPTSRAYAARPWATKGAQLGDDSVLNSRRNPRGRYMTISSSEPLKMEITPTLHSSAGDLILNRSIDNVPDIVKSSQSKVDQIDEDTIDREILFVPDKVLIPERYDAEADAEQLTEEESLARKERAERIRKVLTSQSVLSMSQPDVSQPEGKDIHTRVRQEKKEREHFLALNQELARQVTLKSKKQAAERRKTWSGAQFADAKAQYEAEMAGSPASSSPLRSPDGDRKRAEITLHDL